MLLEGSLRLVQFLTDRTNKAYRHTRMVLPVVVPHQKLGPLVLAVLALQLIDLQMSSKLVSRQVKDKLVANVALFRFHIGMSTTIMLQHLSPDRESPSAHVANVILALLVHVFEVILHVAIEVALVVAKWTLYLALFDWYMAQFMRLEYRHQSESLATCLAGELHLLWLNMRS